MREARQICQFREQFWVWYQRPILVVVQLRAFYLVEGVWGKNTEELTQVTLGFITLAEGGRRCEDTQTRVGDGFSIFQDKWRDV